MAPSFLGGSSPMPLKLLESLLIPAVESVLQSKNKSAVRIYILLIVCYSSTIAAFIIMNLNSDCLLLFTQHFLIMKMQLHKHFLSLTVKNY